MLEDIRYAFRIAVGVFATGVLFIAGMILSVMVLVYYSFSVLERMVGG